MRGLCAMSLLAILNAGCFASEQQVSAQQLPAYGEESIPQPQISNEPWDEINICRAVVRTYFSAKSVPVYVNSDGRSHKYATPIGSYNCKLFKDGSTSLTWTNNLGERMQSNKTVYENEDENVLAVRSEMSLDEYALRNGELVLLTHEWALN